MCRRDYLVQIGVTVAVNICSAIYGAWIAWPSAVIETLLSGNLGYTATKSEISTMVALLDLGTVLTPVPASYLINILGRKTLIHWSCVLFLVASACVLVSTNIWYLYAARVLAGMGKGIVYKSVPLFGAEVASLDIRGAVGVITSTMVACGILFGNVFGGVLDFIQFNVTMLVLPVLLGVVSFFVWETPYFLTMRKQNEKAFKSLKFYRCSSDEDEIKKEMELIMKTVNKDMENKSRFIDVISTAPRRRALLVVSLLTMFQRTAGIVPLTAYATTLILPESGGGLSREAYVVVYSTLLIISHLLSMILVNTLGRKGLLLVSSASSALVTAVFAVFYKCRASGLDITEYNWVPYACLLLYSLTWGVGMCSIPAVLTGELFSMDVKSYASCIATIVYATANFITVKLFGEIEANYGIEITFYIFTLSSFICFLFTLKFVLETKGKTFLEIQTIMSNKWETKKNSKNHVNIM